MKVQSIMTKPVISCKQSDTLDTAAKSLWEGDCGAAPVVANDGRLVGMITDRDICMAAYTRGRPLSELSVDQAMAKKVYSCRPTDKVIDIAEHMRSNRIRRVPVVDSEDKPIGLVSLSDLVRAALRDNLDYWEITHEAMLQTIAEVCEPRVPVMT